MAIRKADSNGREKKLQSQIKGLTLERKVSDWLHTRGWTDVRGRKTVRGHEIDLFATREDWLSGKEYCLVECKACDVTHGHVTKFMTALNDFYKGLPGNELTGKPSVTAYIATTGSVPRNAKGAAELSKIPIKFKQF